jgi:predicted TIM-barrel fold metal-dependent hydrolase
VKTTAAILAFSGLIHQGGNAMKDRHADISARYAETATIPRFAARFYAKYQDRLVYGTDMTFSPEMYQTTFRILETFDEHFYAPMFEYHWSYSGLGLSDQILKKVYRTNALKIIRR